MGSDDASDRLDQLESLAAITRLVHEYCHGADQRDLERFSAVWHPDATWLAPERTEGIEAIRRAIRRQWEALPEFHHWSSNLVVAVDGDRATGESTVRISVRHHHGSWSQSGRIYRDVFERRDGEWRILERNAGAAFPLDADVSAFGA